MFKQAEQDIRVIKTKQKVAMSFRTFKGAEVYVRIQEVIKTIIKSKTSFKRLPTLTQRELFL